MKLELTDVAKPGKTLRMMRLGLGLACQDAMGRVFGWVIDRTILVLPTKPGLLVCFPDLLLTLLMVYFNILL